VAEQRVSLRLEVGPPFRRHGVGRGQILDEELFDETEIGIFELALIHLRVSIASAPVRTSPGSGTPG